MLKKSRDHLKSVQESYFRHLFFAISVGAKMIGAGVAVMLHGLCPAIFQYTGSRTIFKLADGMKSRMAATGTENRISHDS